MQNTSRSECMEKRRRGMVDRKMSRKLKGNVLDSCVVPASTYGLETLAVSELQVCENNWIRRTMKDLQEEI